MARDEVDPTLITNDRRKRKLGSYATNEDNISADKDGVVKRMKNTLNASNSCELKKSIVLWQALKLFYKATNKATNEEHKKTDPTSKIGDQSSADKEMEDGTQIHTEKTQPILVLTDVDEDDDDDLPAPPPPRPKKSKPRKQLKKKPTVIESNDSSSDDQVIAQKKPNNKNLAASLDSDIEEIPNPKETPEDELGEF